GMQTKSQDCSAGQPNRASSPLLTMDPMGNPVPFTPQQLSSSGAEFRKAIQMLTRLVVAQSQHQESAPSNDSLQESTTTFRIW
ncbi:hypothetical protein HAX54_038595, partial [Datura stramonium]|nr:hypothetical protein [Datura stramonium]